MKLAASFGQNSQSSSSETHQFKISANGTAFQILSSGLYSNKHAAVLRELGCNAADAHVAAGIGKTPIVVTLPTETSRDLVIRDFGLGLEHEQVLSLYTTYFSSDKRDSNAYVGGLGLGSKSPFAYTNSFTVTSIHAGIKSIYSCNIAHDGAPTVTRLSREETKEPSGMEVRLLTKLQDVHLFKREAGNVFQWFETPPVLNVEVEFHKASSVVLKTPAYDIVKGIGTSAQSIKMGNVVYPLAVHSLDLQPDSLWAQLIGTVGLILKAPIGHLQVAASREALQYDPTTKKNLMLLYQQAYTDIARRIVAEMDNPQCTTAWMKDCAVLQWVNTYLTDIKRSTLSAMVAQSSASANALRAAAVLVQQHPTLPTFAGSLDDVKVYYYTADTVGRKNVHLGCVRVGDKVPAARLIQQPHSCIVVADDANITEKIAHWRKERELPSLVLVSPQNKKDVSKAKQHANDIAQALGGVPLYLLSEMPLTSVVAPSVKRDYVEIDDRMVDVLDMASGTISTTRFGDVPDSMRYALVRNTNAPHSRGVCYLEAFAPDDKNNVLQYQLKKWHSFFAHLRTNSMMGTLPQGAIVLRPVEVERLKLLDRGIPALIPSICAALRDPTNKNEVAFADALLPVDGPNNGPGVYASKIIPKKASGWLGDFGVALNMLNAQPASQKALQELLGAVNLLERVQARAKSVAPEEHEAWAGYLDLVRHLHTWYPNTTAILRTPPTNQELTQTLHEQHPLLEHVSSRALFDACQGPNACDASLQQVFNLLRLCVGLPIGA